MHQAGFLAKIIYLKRKGIKNDLMRLITEFLDKNAEDIMKSRKISKRSTIKNTDKYNILMKQKEDLMNFAENELIDRFQKNRKK